ncbi:MAG: RHS repeat-associated core domain-containing protein [Chloroflexota bacterium]|nr:RHS repeat-associated core domain-containing protein [Chloroflexota bacterium]
MARQLYHPYGTPRYISGTLPTDFTYTGQRTVPGTGLIFMHARYYHPAMGRFISADTVVPNFTNPQLLNRYSYAGNNPVLYNDPDGHCGPLCVVGILALAGIVWLSTEMKVGEEAPPHDPAAMYWSGVETGIKWGGDTPGDAYALVDEWPENIAPNAIALALPFVPAAVAKSGSKVFELFHGTRFAREAFEAGIDVTKGGGQL